MADELRPVDPDFVDEVRKLDENERTALLSEVRNRYEKGSGAWEENKRLFSEDLRFAFDSENYGQWAPETLQMRQGRPNYTFNRVLQPINMVIADQRQSSPAAKFRPASEGATEDVADIFGGLYRSMMQKSRGDSIVDQQFKYAVAGGFGALRIVPQYVSDDSFDQALYLCDIPNPLTVVWDPECNDPCAGDSNWCIVGDRISREKYRTLYPNGNESNFAMSRDSLGWYTDEEVRVVEFYKRVPVEKEVALLSDGRVIDYDAKAKAVEKHLKDNGLGKDKAARVVKTRKVIEWFVEWCLVDGGNVLEGPIRYKWKRIPVVRVPGRYINIEGRKKFQSLIRHSKDAQRSYNFRRSDMIERSSLTPKAPYLVTAKMIEGYTDIWQTANTAARPFLPYNPDKDAPDQKPTREAPIDMPAGSLALAQQDAADIQATVGMFDPALGNADDMNRVSGKALVQHTRRSDLASYEFIDGLGKALQLLAEMFSDMVPTVMDTERVERIIGADGSERHVTINQSVDGTDELINDLNKGRYDVTVTLGPSYQTARQEALATMIELLQTLPQIGQVAPDLVAKNIDSPDTDEIVRRLRLPMIRAGLVIPTPEEQQQLAATQGPPQQPNPMQVAELDLAQARAAKTAAEAHIATSKASAGDMYIHEHVIESAGKHLANLLAAQKLGLTAREAALTTAAAESQAAAPLSQAVPAAPGAPQIPGQ